MIGWEEEDIGGKGVEDEYEQLSYGYGDIIRLKLPDKKILRFWCASPIEWISNGRPKKLSSFTIPPLSLTNRRMRRRLWLIIKWKLNRTPDRKEFWLETYLELVKVEKEKKFA